ncbi:MAG: hypothetical protein IPH82_20855 [Chloroflexi bacterium]|nr:hypothetical protein [Chloroflexota bacterium]
MNVEQLVNKEVLCCVSCMVEELGKLAGDATETPYWYDDYMDLCLSYDYEEAVMDYVYGLDDLTDLESTVGEVGCWSDAMDCTEYTNEKIEFELLQLEGGEDFKDFDEWFEGLSTNKAEKACSAIHRYILDNVSDYKEFCDNLGIDVSDYQKEIFEYWVVSDWLGRKLKGEGETVVDLLGLTIFARSTTGQCIDMDGVFEKIASDMSRDMSRD